MRLGEGRQGFCILVVPMVLYVWSTAEREIQAERYITDYGKSTCMLCVRLPARLDAV